MNLEQLKSDWRDEPEFHRHVHELFTQLTHADPELHKHRNWVKSHIFGFGEDSFHYFWKLLLSELPENPALLEIGCFRGQILSLWKLLRNDAKIFGITPLDNSGGVWDSNYDEDIRQIHKEFEVSLPYIFTTRSDNEETVKTASEIKYDVVYVDGSHTREDALFDLDTYCKVVKVGGYLVIDDAATRMHMDFGYFQGIQEVGEALSAWLCNDLEDKWEFQYNIVHLMVYRRVKE